MLLPPDDILTTAEAAVELRCSPRQVQRLLKAGLLDGTFRNGRWQTTALAIWRYKGIEADMTRLWLDHWREASADDLS
ncbi:helix-turn-helix domain-containing protein [Tranquillimonas alkanivorans]|uniref:Helix-turn-helix domain-containing protein n=1 Tax=Tranquillimonas alkanivorans TaxID=441119 RepID=A0A1I5VBC3_9RHOB|nr:helix-turn-helix domain-containing protein [Tranquillimonas alkanivorans]SFQ04819.1 hypothetical protein SAMN04488047_1295 [Tranquillimonas alkanivorans]